MGSFADHEAEAVRRGRKRRLLYADEIDPRLLGPGSANVEATSVAPGGVGPGAVQPGTIHGNNIVANSITANHITAHTITADHIATGSLTADVIMAGAITADLIQAGAIQAGHIEAESINAGHIEARSITADRIVAGSITAAELGAGSVTAGAIQAGAILSGAIAAGAITAAMIASGSITTAIIDLVSPAKLRIYDTNNKVRFLADAAGIQLFGPDGTTAWMSPSNGLTSDGIGPDTIGTVHIQIGAVTQSELAAGSVVAGKLAAGAVTAGTVAAGAITAGTIVAGAIDGQQITGATIANDAPGSGYYMNSSGLHVRSSTVAGARYVEFVDASGVSLSDMQHYKAPSYDEFSLEADGAISLVSWGSIIRLGSGTGGGVGGIHLQEGNRLRLRNPPGYDSAIIDVEGAQLGLYYGYRFQAGAANEWGGHGLQYRMRRVDGSGSPSAPSAVFTTATYTETNMPLPAGSGIDVTDGTASGIHVQIRSAAAGSCSLRAMFGHN